MNAAPHTNDVLSSGLDNDKIEEAPCCDPNIRLFLLALIISDHHGLTWTLYHQC